VPQTTAFGELLTVKGKIPLSVRKREMGNLVLGFGHLMGVIHGTT
jgi:hypothetical protein